MNSSNKPHIKLYTTHVHEMLSVDDKRMYSPFLTYLKLSIYVQKHGTYGDFVVNTELAEFCKLSLITLKRHVRIGLRQGWFRTDAYSKTRFELVAYARFANIHGLKTMRTALIYKTDILSITSRNIGRFKTILRDINQQRHLRLQNCFVSAKTYSNKDVNAGQHKKRKKELYVHQSQEIYKKMKACAVAKNGNNNVLPIVCSSLSFASKINDCSVRTIQYDRERQKDMTYVEKKRHKLRYIKKYHSSDYFHAVEQARVYNREVNVLDDKRLYNRGKYFVYNNTLIFSPVTKLVYHLLNTKTKIKSKYLPGYVKTPKKKKSVESVVVTPTEQQTLFSNSFSGDEQLLGGNTPF